MTAAQSALQPVKRPHFWRFLLSRHGQLGPAGRLGADTAGAIKIPKIATWKICLPKARLFQRLLFAERRRVVLSAALADLVEVQFIHVWRPQPATCLPSRAMFNLLRASVRLRRYRSLQHIWPEGRTNWPRAALHAGLRRRRGRQREGSRAGKRQARWHERSLM
jgi:hypothetical protein